MEKSEEQRILDKAIFALKNMIGDQCIDYGKLLAILEGRA